MSLPTGQVLVMGGFDLAGVGVPVPEIYTPGQGWTTLTGATDADTATNYPRMFVNSDGKVVYFSTHAGPTPSIEVMLLDPTGTGSIRKIGALPFSYEWISPAIQYAPGKVLINDSTTGLWTMDINGATPTFNKVGTLSQDRNYSNMTVLADGKVMINGGSSSGNLEAYADKTAVIWDPKTGTLTETVDENNARLYHSTSILLPDGSVLSLGGGSAGMAEKNYLDGQIYKPAYLFDATGAEAHRPVITTAPDHVVSNSTFTITLDNAADLARLTLIKSGSTTHNFNSDAGATDLTFTVGANNVVTVNMPNYANGVSAGAWMLFAWNKAGVPSIAPIIQVDPVPRNLVFNGDLEDKLITATTVYDGYVYQGYDNTGIPGWKNANANYIEQVRYNGTQGIDLDSGAVADAIYQDISTEAGKTYKLHFDVIKVQAGTSAFDVVWNGSVVATVNPTSPRGYDFTVTGTGGNDRLMFRELASQNDSHGAIIDNVSLKQPVQTPTYGNLLTNGDFDAVAMTTPTAWQDVTFQTYDNTGVPGWKNAAANVVEITKVGGTQTLDLDASTAVDAVYQTVNTTAGMSYKLHFDIVRVQAGTSTFDVVWNDNVVASIDPKGAGSFDFSVIGTGGADKLTFREHANQNDGLGASLDNVSLTADPMAGMAHGVTNMLINGDLETNKMTSTAYWQGYDNAGIPGWKNEAANYLELNKVGTTQGLDLDARLEVDSIYQGVKTEAGKTYDLKFDVIAFKAGTSAFQVTWNDAVIALVDPTGLDTYKFSVVGTGSVDKLAFRELASQNDYNGSVIDNIALTPAEAHVHGSTITITAAGQMGTENMVLLIDGVEVAKFDSVSSTQSVYTYHSATAVTADQVRIAFTNDFYDPANGVDRNLKVDKMTIDGKVYETESSLVLSSGVWNDADGFRDGYGRGDTLHTNGYFQYADAPVGSPSTIAITAAGRMGTESMALLIDGVEVAHFDNVSTTPTVYTYNSTTHLSANQVRIAFTNDAYDPANGIDRNLTVDKIVVDGRTFETESSNVLSTGSWSNADGFATGYGRGDTLQTNGYFQYADVPNTGPSTITITAAGSMGTENMSLIIGGVEVAQFNNVSTTPGVYTYQASSKIDVNQVRIAFTNDVYDPAHGIDSNLTVDKISIDGQVFETEASTVLSTGVWTDADGFATGYGRGDTLHTNGYFQYSGTTLNVATTTSPTTTTATSHTSLLSNGSFEATSIAIADGASDTQLSANAVTSWTSSGATVEVWHDGYNEQPGTNGRNVVEIDGTNGALSQMIHGTTPGTVYGLTFDLAGQKGFIDSSKVEVVWNGNVVTTVTPTDSDFHTYKFNVTATGMDTLTFRSTAGDTDHYGALVDNVILHDHSVVV